MTHSPERPFIPHRTPKTASPAVSSSEFRVSRPFVPGAERAIVATFRVDAASQRLEESSSETFPQEFEEQPDELPPLEHFLDPLPPIGEFAPNAGGAPIDESVAGARYSSESAATIAGLETEWVEDDWQRYDWRAAAALGDGVESEASQEWATTDWDSRLPRPVDETPSPAQAIAKALDQIAQRIREGDLTVPPSGDVTDPAAIAASLAALLGVRR